MADTADASVLRQMRSSFASALKDFIASGSEFRILYSVSGSTSLGLSPPKTVYVLDSSFNPPSRAHVSLAVTALKQDHGPDPKRMLLLLAVENADKTFKPAAFEDRLVMMSLMAQDLQEVLGPLARPVDVAVTIQPYFYAKARAIEEALGREVEQVHLTGFDTVTRIFDTKYYPPDHNLRALEPFLSRHRLRVAYRVGDKWDGRAEQDAYVRDIAEGKRNSDGANPEWASKIELVEGMRDGDVVSSTEARKSARYDSPNLDQYVMPRVKQWIKEESLYKEEMTESTH